MWGGLRFNHRFVLSEVAALVRYNPALPDGCSAMTDDDLARTHQLLAEYHRRLAQQAVLDVVQQYHSDLAQRLADEAAQIPRRTAIVERLHERERQLKDDSE
jgi:hypothetical protein